ncbi:hypothetical protein ABZ725_50120 [Streptomyces sp. NPDC006872]|uniref:hypothetical protein n=1 Tax=Streptomyces sp. NPDC006872 TaxID=3155720 RepID=UPI0033FB639C
MKRTGHPDSDRPISDPGSRASVVYECSVRPDRLLTEHFDELKSLELANKDFVVAGSAPLFIHGLRDHVTDLDIVTRESGWDHAMSRARAQSLPGPKHAPHGDALSLYFFDTRIEVLNAWFPSVVGEVDELIRTAKVVDDIRFLTLENTLMWKRHLNRPKDRQDVRRLEEVRLPRLHAGREQGTGRKDADRMTLRGGSAVDRPPTGQVRDTTPHPWSRFAPSSWLRS